MRYILMLEMTGAFPSGIDREYVSLSSEEYLELADRFAGRFVGSETAKNQSKWREDFKKGEIHDRNSGSDKTV